MSSSQGNKGSQEDYPYQEERCCFKGLKKIAKQLKKHLIIFMPLRMDVGEGCRIS